MIDWAKAIYIAGVGFSLVFIILGILSFSVSILSKIVKKFEKMR